MCTGYIFMTWKHWKHCWGSVVFEVWVRSVLERYTEYLKNTATIWKKEWRRCLKNNFKQKQALLKGGKQIWRKKESLILQYLMRGIFFEVLHELWFCFLMQISCLNVAEGSLISRLESMQVSQKTETDTENKQYFYLQDFLILKPL